MSTPFMATAAAIALLGAGFAATEGTRSAFAIPHAQIVEASEIADGAPNCAAKVQQNNVSAPKGSSPATGQAAGMADAKAGNSSCNDNPSPDQSEATQNATGQASAAQTPTAFAPGLPLAPLLAVPASAAGLAVVAANDSAG